MWDEPFDKSMIDGQSRVAINCPDPYLESECAAFLDSMGVVYPDGDSLVKKKSDWGRYREGFCYFVEGRIARRGPKDSPYPYSEFQKCTFCDLDTNEIDDASFDEIIGRCSDGTA